MAEEKKKGRHTLNMEERERVRIGGVMEVLSFDEDGIMMETTCGLLLLKGAGMHIGKLDLEAGDVVVDGSIDSMTYSDGTLAEKHSILGRQAQLFLLTVFLGGGMGLFYDGLRVFRHALRHNAFWVQVEDGLFWLLAVFLVFCVMLHANAGEIRFFTILGLFGGMGLYFLTLSRMVLAVSDKIISAVKYMLGLFGRIVTTPFRLLWLVFRRPARKIGGFCEKQRKKLLQSVKLCVKIIIHRLHINRRMLRKK